MDENYCLWYEYLNSQETLERIIQQLDLTSRIVQNSLDQVRAKLKQLSLQDNGYGKTKKGLRDILAESQSEQELR